MNDTLRVRVLKMDGAAAPRVLRFDTAFSREGCGDACGAILYRLAAALVGLLQMIGGALF